MSRRFAPFLVTAAIASGMVGWAAGAHAGEVARTSSSCPGQLISTVDGCKGSAAVKAKLNRIVKESKQSNFLRAVVARVDVDGKRLLRRGYGESQTGVPATPEMNFRVGSMTIPVLTSVVYQLRDQGRLELTQPISKWLPSIPRASQVSIRMLMNNTSGYLDWIQGNDDFIDALYADPFRIWTDTELLTTALARGYACDPGTCFHYAHTNFLILARVVRKLAPGSLISQLRKRVLGPTGVKMAFSRLAPIPGPVLSSFTPERGFYEDSTNWSPSWGLGAGMLATTSIDNVTRLAQGILSGRTLSRGSRRDLVKRYGPNLGPAGESLYFAQGLIMANGWRRQNPFFNGYMGNVAWFPARRISISLVATRGLAAPVIDGSKNFTDDILGAMAAYLTPANSPTPPRT
jgi:CubicO group peptidase (beta-lactamase class C family)